jgi:ectoine hydroxylase-related dioxygenase (phytanoyl-CoA dioxygenase family)
MILLKKQIEDFESNGYLILKNVFSEDELESFASAVSFIAKNELNRAGISSGNKINQVTEDVIKLNKCGLMDRYATLVAGISEVSRLHSTPLLRSAINQLLKRKERAALFLTNNAAIINLPNDPNYTYAWHKDTFYTIPQSRYIQIWAPLIQSSSVKNGTLSVCLKSHQNGLNGQTKLANVPNRLKYVATDAEVKKYSQADLELELGSVLIFDPGLIHKSGSNTSGKVRYSLVGVYHDTDFQDFHPVGKRVVWGKKTPDDYYDESSTRKSH